jgi:hypothetical protein
MIAEMPVLVLRLEIRKRFNGSLRGGRVFMKGKKTQHTILSHTMYRNTTNAKGIFWRTERVSRASHFFFICVDTTK